MLGKLYVECLAALTVSQELLKPFNRILGYTAVVPCRYAQKSNYEAKLRGSRAQYDQNISKHYLSRWKGF